ncbi:hypothetical protein ACXR0O_13670 [Verrucomicrobiota bacterium sgz303538]
MVATVPNVVGEREREARSPRANALEALFLACGVLILLWPLGFVWGILGGSEPAGKIAELGLKGVMFWMLVGSPLWHRDSAESLGFGSPGRLWRLIRERRGVRRWRLIAVVLAIFAGLLALSFNHWPQVARFLRLPTDARAWPESPAQWVAMSGFSVALAALVTTCAIRYDNFRSAFHLSLQVCAALIIYAGLAAWLQRGGAAFERINAQYPLDVIAYVFWGFIQQIAFTAYFSTRLRKGFGAIESTSKITSSERRRYWVLYGGITAALTFGPVVWFTVRSIHGPEVPLVLLPAAMLFAFPMGTVWTHFYCLDKRRMLVATLSGSFFGIIHADSYGLVLVTSTLGTIFAYAAMEDRFRNLAAFGIAHGFLGSTFSKLFRDAGILQVNYRVGPWNVREPSVSVLIIPMLCLCGYALCALWIAKYLRNASAENAGVHSPVDIPVSAQTPVSQ